MIIPALIGFFAGIIGGLLGVGGSIIVIPAMIIYLRGTAGFTGSDYHLIFAVAMISNFFVSMASVVFHGKANAIVKPAVKWLIPSAVVFTLIGVWVSNKPLLAGDNGKYLAITLGFFLFYVAGYNFWRLKKENHEKALPPEKINIPGSIYSGSIMGLVAGALGIGGGTICVPMQQFLLKMPLKNAIANSAATIVPLAFFGAIYKNATLFDKHGVTLASALLLAVSIVPTAVVGSFLGAKLVHLMSPVTLRIIFICFMITMGCITLYQTL